VLAFSFPRYSTSTLKAAQYCNELGATVIGITNSNLSPLTKYCDYVLAAKSDMVSLVDSLVAPLSVVNALLVALAAAREEVLQKNFEKLERVWEEYNVYEKGTQCIDG
jgi:DNA-binding MurR/RpiR family transcriptional regulator